jgi:aldose 1-epimerase
VPVGRAPVARAPFGTTRDGQAVEVFTLTNAHDVEVRAITYGGIVVSLRTPDRDGRLDDIVLGFDTLDGYERDSPYFGAIVGRYGNRIAHGRFRIDGTTYQLSTNDGKHHLHGGLRGFDKVVWGAETFDGPRGAGVVFTHSSGDGDQGYPGSLAARVTYALTDRDELVVDFRATTDRPTHVNLTQHSYFNLAGGGRRDVLDHELTINASRYTPVDVTLIPTGELAPVAGTPFDFRTPTALGARIGDSDEQLGNGRGYDHNFVLDRDGSALVHAARVRERGSGRLLDVHTTEPGLQLYSGNFLGQVGAGIRGKSGRLYGARYGFCLETQHFPDSPNKPHFPSTLLRPGDEYRTRTVFKFGIG